MFKITRGTIHFNYIAVAPQVNLKMPSFTSTILFSSFPKITATHANLETFPALYFYIQFMDIQVHGF